VATTLNTDATGVGTTRPTAVAVDPAPGWRETARSAVERIAVSGGVIVASVATGYGLATMTRPGAGSRMLPWIAGRSLGLGAVAALTVLTALGIWLRHPWRAARPIPSPEFALRAHAALAAAVLVLVAGHVTALALDKFANVGWLGTFVPGFSGYRTTPVALGVVAFWLMLLIAGSAGLAGRVGGSKWIVVHRLALPAYGLVWVHGVLAGTDSASLRPAYALGGAFIVVLAFTRFFASGSAPK